MSDLTITLLILLAAVAFFDVAEGLDAAGITTWAWQQVIAHAGTARPG
jgi:hypothetical protein